MDSRIKIIKRTFKEFFKDPIMGKAIRYIDADGLKKPYHRVELYLYPGMKEPFKDTEDHELGHLLGNIQGCNKPWCLQYESSSELLDKFVWIFCSSWMWPIYRLFSKNKRCPTCRAMMPEE